MKKLIALTAVAVMASSAAIADIAISGTASVTYDDNGSTPSETTYDTDLSVVGSMGSTTVTIGVDLGVDGTDNSDAADNEYARITGVDLVSSIGPLTITADMFDEISKVDVDDNEGGQRIEKVDSSVSVSLDVPVGDMTVGLEDSGDITLGGTFSGVTITHTIQDGDDKTTGEASIAGIDVTVENDAGDSTWSIGTTISSVALTLNNEKDVSATVGLNGNTMVVSHIGAREEVAQDDENYGADAVAAYSKVEITRDLTSGATLTATYSSDDDSLALKASVEF